MKGDNFQSIQMVNLAKLSTEYNELRIAKIHQKKISFLRKQEKHKWIKLIWLKFPFLSVGIFSLFLDDATKMFNVKAEPRKTRSRLKMLNKKNYFEF